MQIIIPTYYSVLSVHLFARSYFVFLVPIKSGGTEIPIMTASKIAQPINPSKPSSYIIIGRSPTPKTAPTISHTKTSRRSVFLNQSFFNVCISVNVMIIVSSILIVCELASVVFLFVLDKVVIESVVSVKSTIFL